MLIGAPSKSPIFPSGAYRPPVFKDGKAVSYGTRSLILVLIGPPCIRFIVDNPDLGNSVLNNMMPGMVPFPASSQAPAGLTWNIPGTTRSSPPGIVNKDKGAHRGLGPPGGAYSPLNSTVPHALTSMAATQYGGAAGPVASGAMSKEMGNLLASTNEAMKLNFCSDTISRENIMQSILFKSGFNNIQYIIP